MKLIIISSFLILYVSLKYSKSQKNDRKIDGLNKAIEFIYDGLDRTQDPCSSFYNYACGNWLKNNKGKGDYNEEFGKSALHFKKLLLDDVKSVDVTKIETKEYAKSVRVFFDQCLNLKFDKKRETIELYNAVERIVGPIPIFEEYAKLQDVDHDFTVWTLNGALQRHLQAEFLFRMTVSEISKDCKRIPTMILEPLDWGDVRDDEKFIEPRLIEVAAELNLTFDRNQLKEEIKKVIQLRKVFQKLSFKDNYSEIRIKFKELQTRIPEIPWKEYFDSIDYLDHQFMKDYNKTNPEIVVKSEQYFHELPSVLTRFSNSTVINFAYLQVMRISKKLFSERTEELRVGASEKRCFDLTLKHLLPSTLRIHFDRIGINLHEWKYDIELMQQSTFSAFRYLVSGLDWLDSREKTMIMKKVREINFLSGIPEWIMRDDELKQIAPIFDAEKSLYENDLLNEGQKFVKKLRRLLNPRKIKDPDPIFDYGAFYRTKTIDVRLGFVLPPFYHFDYPLAKKYGTLGWIIAHELMHAFDSFWLLDEEVGGLKYTHWLYNDTLKMFHDKNHCLVKQYSKFCYQDLKECVRGRKTINDNIADVNGLKIAYLAYKFASQAAGTPEPPLPQSLNMTYDELFFLSAARIWCGEGEDISSHIRSDEHAPRHARVDVSMKNFPSFAKTYKCSIGNNLAPLEICSLWGDVVGTN